MELRYGLYKERLPTDKPVFIMSSSRPLSPLNAANSDAMASTVDPLGFPSGRGVAFSTVRLTNADIPHLDSTETSATPSLVDERFPSGDPSVDRMLAGSPDPWITDDVRKTILVS